MIAGATTEQVVLAILANQLGINVNNIQNTDTLELSLGADSLDVVEIVIAIEEELEITIEDSDVDSAKTVGDLVALVNRVSGGQ